jgi:hypothetical protein
MVLQYAGVNDAGVRVVTLRARACIAGLEEGRE